MPSRRQFLSFAGGAVLRAGSFVPRRLFAETPGAPRTLSLGTRTIDVHGRAATVFGILDGAGQNGLDLYQSEGFDVRLANGTDASTVIHWHGLTPPFEYDGTEVAQALVAPGTTHDYRFDLSRSGTFWMHSHHGLTEQSLLAAPLIVRADSERAIDRQDVTIMLHDFSFTPPEELLARLTGQDATVIGSGTAAMNMGMMRTGPGSMAGMDHSGTAGMDNGSMPGTGAAPAMGEMAGMDHAAMGHGNMQMDLNDIAFDAYLANDRDLSDPLVVPVDRGGRVRLRIINGAASTNFWIDLGGLNGTLVAVDGMDVSPVFGGHFEIAMAQRLDIEVVVPGDGGVFPILAQREGDRTRTGIVLATAGAQIAKVPSEAERIAPPVLLDLERQLVAAAPLAARTPDRRIALDLTGDMMSYVWGLNGLTYEERSPLEVTSGDRVEITLRNQTMMSHPMHLHGHHFQVVGLGAARLNGALRDTVIVPPMESVTIAFDADNPGEWPLHCHNLYHMAAGMMTTVEYV
ncbi:copper oxidase [Pseudooceanicola sediminis]|uniref:Copper oxidase n=2 Tax=Pseudooceanicola sediminis TaxID=2211117 RepID=A0A399IXQ4_9RHOB|nr:multicopper oxidase domain-containing protein [Puniceibacterium sp. HSS470]MCB1466943.1 multicopper oxidase domain-containing protein [Rhizobiaceae bacterium]RII37227.1 copper oxidase [Pseudooceanicola sediminis]